MREERGMKKKRATKSKALRRLPAKRLTAKQAKGVKGGITRKAGKAQQEYLVVKMNDLLISG